MATTRITALAELAEVPADDDVFALEDVSSGTTKKVTAAHVRSGLAATADLATVGAAVATHSARTDNPHGVTATQAGAIPATSGAATAYVSAASEAAAGISELATLAETVTGTDTARVVTVAGGRQALLSTLRDSLGRFPGIIPPSFNLFMGDATTDTAPTGTFTRSTTATRQGQTGLVETVAAAGVRRSWNDDGSPRGWLIEESRTNVALYGRDLTNAAWTKTNCTVALTQTGVDGAANAASLLTATADGATCLQAASVSSSARFQTAYIKRVAGTGAVSMTMDGGATWTDVTASLSSTAWTRVSIPGQTLATLSIGFRLAGSGDAIAVDGVQNEAGAFSTAPIFTTTAAVARSADVWTTTLASSWFKAAGTFFIAARTPNGVTASTARNLIQIDDGTINNRLRIYRDGTRGVSAGAYVAGSSVGSVAIGTINDATAFKMALCFGTSLAVSLNGAAVATGALSAFPTAFSTLRIGADLSGAYQWCGHLLHLAYWPQVLTNAQLQALTL